MVSKRTPVELALKRSLTKDHFGMQFALKHFGQDVGYQGKNLVITCFFCKRKSMCIVDSKCTYCFICGRGFPDIFAAAALLHDVDPDAAERLIYSLYEPTDEQIEGYEEFEMIARSGDTS